MQIGEFARRVGTTTDTVRFYEKVGVLPRAVRRGNTYRDYGDDAVEHLSLLLELRRVGLPLTDAATIAGWCHSGHCSDTTSVLPVLLRDQRAEIATRMASLRELDQRLERLERHITGSRSLSVLETTTACCAAAEAVLEGGSGCGCCSATSSFDSTAAPRPRPPHKERP